MQRGSGYWWAACVVLLLLPTSAAAQITLDRVVIGQGGGQVRNGTLVMNVTIGEPVVGTTTAESVSLDFGYWWSVLIANVDVPGGSSREEFALGPSAPNPFTTRTLISYLIPAGNTVPVFVGVYDVRGALVRTLVRTSQGAGTYNITWDGRSDGGGLPAAGIYFATIKAGPFHQTRKLVMVK